MIILCVFSEAACILSKVSADLIFQLLISKDPG